MCRFCGETPETAAHLYAEYPRFSVSRFHIIGVCQTPIPIPEWSPEQLLTFLRLSPITQALQGLNPEYLRGLSLAWSESDPDLNGSTTLEDSLL